MGVCVCLCVCVCMYVWFVCRGVCTEILTVSSVHLCVVHCSRGTHGRDCARAPVLLSLFVLVCVCASCMCVRAYVCRVFVRALVCVMGCALAEWRLLCDVACVRLEYMLWGRRRG